MQYVVDDASRVWTWYYQQWYGSQYGSSVHTVFPRSGEVASGPCGSTNNNTMMYCSVNDTIYFSQDIATRLWNGTFVGPDGQRSSSPGGDFAVATMLAHEYGHNVQAEIWGQDANGGMRLVSSVGVPKDEQHADCLSGVFAQVAQRQGILDPNDINEGLRVAFMVGDSYFTASDHHGTSQERENAWWSGYKGSPAGCDAILNG